MTDRVVAARLRIALDMYELGERMQRQRLKRSHPEASEADLAAMLRAWRMRPAVAGHPGRPSRRFE